MADEEFVELVPQRAHVFVGLGKQMAQLRLLLLQCVGLACLKPYLRGTVDRDTDRDQTDQTLHCQPIGEPAAK